MKPELYRAGLFALLFMCLNHISLANDVDLSVKVWLTIENEEFVPTHEDGVWVSSDPILTKIFNEFQVSHCERAFPASRRANLLKVYEIHGIGGFEQFSAALGAVSYCRRIEQAPEYELLSVDPFPNDYHLTFANDYALDLIDAEKAWEYSTGDPNTVIGIVDGAFFLNHEELIGATTYAQNPTFAPQNFYYHGTAVATTAAGNTNNGLGKSAIGYNCNVSLIPMGYSQMLELCYQGVRIINASWSSGCQYNSYYTDVMDELFDNDVIVVASAGNGNTCGGPNGVVYPAALDGVISVTSVGPYDNHEMVIGNPNTTHQHNEFVDICAPGYQIAGTPIPGYYTTGSGTSYATPYVSGTIGLMLSLRPCLSREEVIDILSITAADVYAVNPSDLAGLLGAGRLDAGAALEYVANYECSDAPMVVDTTIGFITLNNPKPMGGGIPNLSPDGTFANQTAGMDASVLTAQLKVYPNPSRGQFKVIWDGMQPQQILVSDAMGKRVLIQEQSPTTASAEIKLEQTGVYFLQLIQEGSIIATEKVIVQ